MKALTPKTFVGFAELDIMTQVKASESAVRDVHSPPLPDLFTSLAQRKRAPSGHEDIAEKQHFNIRTAYNFRSNQSRFGVAIIT